MVAQVQSQVKSCGICGGPSGTDAGYLQVLGLSTANSHSTNCSAFANHLIINALLSNADSVIK
jgi:hypothetical protein